ncbi:DMT family transporter [Bauldia sp.]|uniref:DMT family transporter n=1 Tax=Bauldia sp. TaxID=2575872 RepID=UPI0025C07324|nr:DMT family transporter [Bauldia sp.]
MTTQPATPAATPAIPAAEAPPGPGYVRMGYVFAAVGALLFSTKAVIIKLAYGESIDAETLLALRMAFSLPFYFGIGWLSIRDRQRSGKPLPSGREVVAAAGVGLLGYWFASYTDFLGLEYISAQFERLILFTYPLFVVIFGAMFFRQPIRLRAVLAIGVSYAGLAVIFGEKVSTFGHDIAIGAGFVLLAAIAFAMYQLLARGLIATIGPRLFTCIAMSGAAVGAFAQFFLTHPAGDLIVSSTLYGYALLIAIGATVLPSFFLNAALHRISAQANATIGTLSPVMTILLAVLILGERITLVDIAGTALVLAGVGWFTLADQAAFRRKNG